MNWENSKALTPLKRDFLLAFFRERQDFFLTGGSALGIFYLDHRMSYDLDLFTRSSIEWLPLEKLLESIAEEIGAGLTPLSRSPKFHRYELVRRVEKEIVDFVVENVPQLFEKKNSFGPILVDTLEEIGINKICTLLGRGEIKDVIDLYFLAREGFDVVARLPDASRKEGGIDPGMIAFLLSGIRIASLPDYLLRKVSVEELNAFVVRLQTELAALSFPEDGDLHP